MNVIADLQVHSKYARATSKDLSLAKLEEYGRMKGLTLIGTGDFQHPQHRKDIDAYCVREEKGILYSPTGFPFLWQTEVSLMFSKGGRRAIHILVFAPDRLVADLITQYLGSKGRLDYDGRPIFGITGEQFVHDLKAIDDRIELIPAHCMTPWFGLFGSDSGFDTLQDCFGEESRHIYAVESGMSADPSMLWGVAPDKTIVSFSDAHSFWPWRLGREATIFEIPELSYEAIMHAIRTGVGISATIETPPEYGKYHWDGHRNCNFSSNPLETKKLEGVCPVCKKSMTIGVDYRVQQLARTNSSSRKKPFYKLVPLHELIAFFLESKLETKKTWAMYNQIITQFPNELFILLTATPEQLRAAEIPEILIKLILENRVGKLFIKPGYDGLYGVIQHSESQKKLV